MPSKDAIAKKLKADAPDLSDARAQQIANQIASSKQVVVASGNAQTGGDDYVSVVTRRSGYGSFDTAATMTFFGHNHRGTGNAIQNNNEQYGMTFFTRPRLNLSYDNIINDRTFTPMLSNEPASIWRAVRAILDPVGAIQQGYTSPLVDPLNAFIPLLDNLLISLNGWPDPVVDTYTSKSGMYREEWSMVDGFAKIYNSYDLSANFQNIVDDPVSYLFHTWSQYAALVHEGHFDPYPECIVENEIDYNTRIYRLTLDPGRQFVKRIGACGAAFPTTNSLGSHFNYSRDKPYNPDSDQISINFRAMGAIYYDPILVVEFNDTVAMHNPMMDDATRRSVFTKLSPGEKVLFNYVGYPRIDPLTMELEWWVLKDDYNRIMGLDKKL